MAVYNIELNALCFTWKGGKRKIRGIPLEVEARDLYEALNKVERNVTRYVIDNAKLDEKIYDAEIISFKVIR